MSTSEKKQDREARFSKLYGLVYNDVLRFIQRRAGPDHAEDIAHEAFMAAWRRLDHLPSKHDEARAWLFATARNCMLNNQRGQARQGALAVRVATWTPTFVDAETDMTHLCIDLAAAWQRLRPEDQETLSLAIWEDLPSSQAGQVLGISSAAYRIRLHRARKSLRRELDSSPYPASLAESLMTE
ncbi:RNA polymerase sigma factor [Paeniglutamicibacter antarcticus]|uniref:Sigma-70 family RNA polymerase sigma factor n=1 Tax=Paeniglutamicibacter antarcticus TaxID=494023 RepID=A0ABP9TQW9_9MICC